MSWDRASGACGRSTQRWKAAVPSLGRTLTAVKTFELGMLRVMVPLTASPYTR